MTYPRYGRPSASGMHRVSNCPGSHKREAMVPEKESSESRHGDRIHAALAGTLPFGMLTAQEAQTAEMCQRQRDELFDQWEEKGINYQSLYLEKRLGLTAYVTVIDVTPEMKADIMFTGQFDALFIQRDRALLIDYKSLYGDVPEAVDNEQIVSLAVLVALRYRPTSIRAAVIQPRVGPPTVVDFDMASLAKAAEWLNEALEKEQKATVDDVTAGDWCKFCKAKASCPAFIAARDKELELMQPMKNGHLSSQAMWASMSEIAGRLSDAELIGRYRGLAMAKAYPEVIRAEMERRATEQEGFPFELRATREKGNREITNAQEAFTRLAPLGVNEADMIAASSVRVTDLQEAIRIRSGVKSTSANGAVRYNLTAAQAKDALAAALGPVLQHKEPPLELVPVNNTPTIES